jgi:hypothetical protein
MSFRDCIQHALNDGMIDRHEAEDLTKRFESLEASERAGLEGPGFAKMELERQLTDEALEAKRRKLLAAKAANNARSDIHRYAMEQGPDVAAAIFRMFENFGFTGYGSVRNGMSALIGAAHSEMEEAIHAFRRSGLTMQRRGLALLDEVVNAAFGKSNDPAAQALYNAWLRPAEKLREKFNAAGGNIGMAKDWGLPMSHDAGALLAAGFGEWEKFIEPRLDWDRMKHGVTGARIYPAEREDVLWHVWQSIVTDGWNTRQATGRGFGGTWSKRQDARFLHFSGPEDWRDYNKAFGRGDVWAVMTSHIRTLARDVALMERFGPNPSATVEWLKAVVQQEAMKGKAGMPSLFPKPKIGTYDGAALSAQSTIDGLFSLARGDSGAADGAVADTFAIWRNVQYAAKLGTSIVAHAVLNPIVQSYARHIHGIPMTGQLMDMVAAFTESGEREATRAGYVVQDALHVLEQGAREAAAGSRMRQLSNWLPAVTVHYSGLEPFVAAQRRAFIFGVMAHVADHLDREWSDVPDRLRRLLAGYGLRKDDWAVMRLAATYEPSIGSAPFLRFSDIADVGRARPDDVVALGLKLDPTASKVTHPDVPALSVDTDMAALHTEAVAMKYLAMLHGETQRAVPSSSWRMRQMLTRGTREGTFLGEAARSFGMFKGFIGAFMMTQFEAMKQEIARDRTTGAAAAGAYLTALTLGGMVVLQLKSLVAGKDFRSIDPTKKEGVETWAHAALTSGGFGIFGDFIASDHSAYGHGPLETLAGPTLTGGIDLYTGLRNLGQGKKTTGQKLSGAMVDALRNNTPLFSTHWAFRAAYNRILMDQLQYLADPDAHSRFRDSEARLRKETGQGMWWHKGEVYPSRLPAFATGN